MIRPVPTDDVAFEGKFWSMQMIAEEDRLVSSPGRSLSASAGTSKAEEAKTIRQEA
jgi:hypothetical protein